MGNKGAVCTHFAGAYQVIQCLQSIAYMFHFLHQMAAIAWVKKSVFSILFKKLGKQNDCFVVLLYTTVCKYTDWALCNDIYAELCKFV